MEDFQQIFAGSYNSGGMKHNMHNVAEFQGNEMQNMERRGSVVAQPKKRSFACPWKGCNRMFKKKDHMKSHMRQHTGETPVQCPVQHCGLRFKWRSSLKNHMRYHTPQSVCQVQNSAPRRNVQATREPERMLSSVSAEPSHIDWYDRMQAVVASMDPQRRMMLTTIAPYTDRASDEVAVNTQPTQEYSPFIAPEAIAAQVDESPLYSKFQSYPSSSVYTPSQQQQEQRSYEAMPQNYYYGEERSVATASKLMPSYSTYNAGSNQAVSTSSTPSTNFEEFDEIFRQISQHDEL